MEENPGFTFVDKRSTPSENENKIGDEPAAPDSMEDDLDEFDDSGLEDGPAPSVYSMVMYTLQMFVSTAWFKLGLMADPSTGQVEANLPEAKIAIDIVGDLVGRLEGAPEDEVPAQQIKELKRVLNDLRLNFVSRQSTPNE